MTTSAAKPARSLAVLLLTVAVLAASCGGGEEPQVTQSPTLVPVPTIVVETTAEPTATETETEVGPTFPLTGVEAGGSGIPERPVLGVKVDNAPQALPQVGLAEADIVFEELVEGGVTRFLAVYHSADPGEVGPVRSGRDVDADLFPPFQGVLAISGAAGPTYSVLFGAGLVAFEEGQAGGGVYRVSDRPAPHNLNAVTELLWEAGAEQPSAVEPWPFDAEFPAGGEPVEAVTAAFSDDYAHSWAWRGDQGVFERGQNGERHLTADGAQIAAANVVYASVTIGSGGGVDVRGSGTVSVELIGEGTATFLRDGQAFEGTWRKTGRDAQFEWLDDDGRPFPLAPGVTWVELQPSTFGVDTAPTGPVDADAETGSPTEG